VSKADYPDDDAITKKPDYQTMHKQLCKIAAVQMDWYQGITSAQEAMIEISEVFEFHNAREEVKSK